jgi:hypothetical protein
MIKFSSEDNVPLSVFWSVNKEYINSEYNIFVFDWWEWIRTSQNQQALYQPDISEFIKSIDAVIEEIKKYDICFFVIKEVLNCGSNNNIRPVLHNMMAELEKLNVFYIRLSRDKNFPTAESKTLNMPWFIEKDIYMSKDTTIDFDYRPKDFTFNMLLGAENPYRTQLFEMLHSESYLYSTYMGHKDFRLKSNSNLEDRDIWNNLTNQDLSKKLNTMESIIRDDRGYCISHVIPKSIYNNSHFDIVCESNPCVTESLNDYHVDLTTEKTGKPLSAGRFFIWHNKPNQVEYLKQFGFELQDYLCEYDSIIDDDERLKSIIELIKEIGNRKNWLKKIYKHTKDARIHNQEVYNKLSKEINSNIDSWMYKQIKNPINIVEY